MERSRTPLEEFVSAAEPQALRSGDGIDKVLHAVRTHLQMDVAFVAQFRRDDRVFNHVDAAGRSPIKAGDAIPLDQGFCQKVVAGQLPELIADAQSFPATAALPETRGIPIGSHLSVPIRLKDGRIYGTFCCFSFIPDHSLTERDLQMMRAFAELVADRIDVDLEAAKQRETETRRIQKVMAEGQPSLVYQPIYDLHTARLAGVEALSRFQSVPTLPPDVWFKAAGAAGLRTPLEGRALSSAVQAMAALPANVYMSVNASPEFIINGRLTELLAHADAGRIVLEITEHDSVADYAALADALAPVRAMGVRIAIDDAGAGYASMRHILSIEPEFIKLDLTLVRGIDKDRKRRALAAALIAFAAETAIGVVAEGVESAAELQTLYALGAEKVQGYFLARPMQLSELHQAMALNAAAAMACRGIARPANGRTRNRS
ncbi:MAG: EAL domain-containing protein [Sinobacteraceae bacterium]|nr:EAL domain-containing protein [Nevskiaceae bacterium]